MPSDWLTGCFAGFLIATSVFSVAMAFLFPKRVALLLHAAVSALGVYVLASSGWSIFVYGAAFAAFGYAFLELHAYDKPFAWTLIGSVVIAILGPVLRIEALGALPLLVLAVASVRALTRSFGGARFFVVGSAGAYAAIAAGYSLVGILWAAFWGTLALADRINQTAGDTRSERVTRAELEVLAELDPLTGIPNRRAFDEHLESGWKRALRSSTSLGMIMLDVDRFKEYNDICGHVAGDLCLSKVAHACSSALKRNGDFIARYGGEEFAAILVTQSLDDLALIAERMRQAVENEAIPHPKAPGGIVTISLGAARLRPIAGETPLHLVEAADAALYDAKARGRNQVGTTLFATS